MTFKSLFGPITKLSSSFVTFRVSRFPVSHLTYETFNLHLQNTLNMSKTTRVYFGVLQYIMNASMHSCIYIFIYSFLYSYLFISFIHHILYAFLSGFSYSCTLYISIVYAFTYSYIHIIYTYIHILSYTCFYCQMPLYCISCAFPYYLLCHVLTMSIILVQVLIPMLCHLLLISIVRIIYTFLSCVPSMFHLIPFGMSII